MALCFLPPEHVSAAFDVVRLLIERRQDARLTQLADYVQSTWIQSGEWPPTAWSAYKETVRTNNDLEGWLTLKSVFK